MSTEHETTGRHFGLSRRKFLAASTGAAAAGAGPATFGPDAIPTGSRHKSDCQRVADNFNRPGALAAAGSSPYVSRSRA